MQALLKMIIVSTLMTIGFGLLFCGIILWSIGREADQVLAITFLTIGLIFGPCGLYLIIRMNRQFQETALKKALAQPEKILLRFPSEDGKKEIVITQDALFIGRSHIPFKAFYGELEGLRMEGNLMFFETKAVADDSIFHRTKKIVVPNAQINKATAVMEQLKKDYQL